MEITKAEDVAAIVRATVPRDNAMDVARTATRPVPVGGSMSEVSAAAGIQVRLPEQLGPTETGRFINFNM